jgi:hypothetical protein
MSEYDGKLDGRQPLLEAAATLAAAAEAAITDLEQRVPTGMGPLERALAARVRAAVARLLECAGQLAADNLMIRGSTGQPRPHPLLKTEQELRREISAGLKELTFRAEQRALVVRLNTMTGNPNRRRGTSS